MSWLVLVAGCAKRPASPPTEPMASTATQAVPLGACGELSDWQTVELLQDRLRIDLPGPRTPRTTWDRGDGKPVSTALRESLELGAAPRPQLLLLSREVFVGHDGAAARARLHSEVQNLVVYGQVAEDTLQDGTPVIIGRRNASEARPKAIFVHVLNPDSSVQEVALTVGPTKDWEVCGEVLERMYSTLRLGERGLPIGVAQELRSPAGTVSLQLPARWSFYPEVFEGSQTFYFVELVPADQGELRPWASLFLGGGDDLPVEEGEPLGATVLFGLNVPLYRLSDKEHSGCTLLPQGGVACVSVPARGGADALLQALGAATLTR